MPAIKKIVIKNFKRIADLTLEFDPSKNILIGDNETGKSSVLLALDLALSASRSRVENIGYEALLNQGAVQNFLAGPARLDLLPEVIVDVFLERGTIKVFTVHKTFLEYRQMACAWRLSP